MQMTTHLNFFLQVQYKGVQKLSMVIFSVHIFVSF